MATHEPVLLAEVLELLAVSPDSVVVDATVGYGGHARAILERLGPRGVLFGLDRDLLAVAHCERTLGADDHAPEGPRVRIAHGTFRELASLLGRAGLPRVDALLADLGLSSPQLDEPARGFSFSACGPLDMRADPSRGESARDLVTRLDERTLADLLHELGEERQARRIARAIRAAVQGGRMETTADLRAAVGRAAGGRRRGRIDPSTRTFQALRIAVNDELGQLDALLSVLPDLLAVGGRAAVLSYHSLEDRRVKHAFRDDPWLEPLTRKPIVAGPEERVRNPRARSAKLRVARRRDDAAGPVEPGVAP